MAKFEGLKCVVGGFLILCDINYLSSIISIVLSYHIIIIILLLIIMTFNPKRSSQKKKKNVTPSN